jgi:hypothetical protein
MRHLEFSINELFDSIQPDLDELEAPVILESMDSEVASSTRYREILFEKERDEIMLKRFQLDHLK